MVDGRDDRPSAYQFVIGIADLSDEGYRDSGTGSEDAASLAVFLASDDSAYMTGQDINCGGGVMW